MKPFSLDTVLNYRERLVNLAQEKLALARRAEDRVKEKLDSESRKYDTLVNNINLIQEQGVSINELISQEEHLNHVREQIHTLEKELEQKAELVKKAHQHLVEKSKDCQVMEKLKERQDEAWRQYLNKKEAAILDEMAIVFHERK